MDFCSVVLIDVDKLVLDLKVNLLCKVDKILFLNGCHVYNDTKLTMYVLLYDNGEEEEEFSGKRHSIERYIGRWCILVRTSNYYVDDIIDVSDKVLVFENKCHSPAYILCDNYKSRPRTCVIKV